MIWPWVFWQPSKGTKTFSCFQFNETKCHQNFPYQNGSVLCGQKCLIQRLPLHSLTSLHIICFLKSLYYILIGNYLSSELYIDNYKSMALTNWMFTMWEANKHYIISNHCNNPARVMLYKWWKTETKRSQVVGTRSQIITEFSNLIPIALCNSRVSSNRMFLFKKISPEV